MLWKNLNKLTETKKQQKEKKKEKRITPSTVFAAPRV